MKTLNFNVGLLGHVDSGKTSLAKVLSSVSSTAAFDKDPQSQERGITLDLGFSSFSCPAPSHLEGSPYDTIQYTLVDCPGHASLIKTIIGGSHIIDLMILVIDATKGFQTQTSECLIIGEITGKKIITVLNKVDMLKDETAVEKLLKKVKLTLDGTVFKGCTIVTASALTNKVSNLLDALHKATFIPSRTADKPFLFAVDHCFALRGKGTILTGTVLQGKAKVNDDIEIPSISLTRKIKSMEMFRKPVDVIVQGDRAGICVTQFDPKTLERGLACEINYLPKVYAAIVDFNKVKYYKGDIVSKSMFHVNIGYENVISKIILFGRECDPGEKLDFDISQDYKYIGDLNDTADESKSMQVFALLEFSKPVLIAPHNLAIGARLDAPINSNSCRLAFHGRVLVYSTLRNYQTEFLPTLKIYKDKHKRGVVERVVNEYELIGKNMFKKETNIEKFVGMKIRLSSGESGSIDSSFGQSGKFKVRIPGGCTSETLAKHSGKKESTASATTEILLDHKRYIFDPEKRMMQN